MIKRKYYQTSKEEARRAHFKKNQRTICSTSFSYKSENRLENDDFFMERGLAPHENYFLDVLKRPPSQHNFIIIDKGLFQGTISLASYEEKYTFYTKINHEFTRRKNIHAKNSELVDALYLALLTLSNSEGTVCHEGMSTNGKRNLDGLKKFFRNQWEYVLKSRKKLV